MSTEQSAPTLENKPEEPKSEASIASQATPKSVALSP
jgi:hypothetical protein